MGELFKNFSFKDWVGLRKHSPYEEKYLDHTNAKASVYMAVIVIILESWMILSLIKYLVDKNWQRSPMWIFQHAAWYVILLSCSAVLLYFAIKILRGKEYSHKAWRIMTVGYCAACIAFGINISLTDYSKGEQILTFITMELFAMSLLVWRSWISFLVLSGTFLFFYFRCNAVVPTTYATQVNLFTTWIAMMLVAINNYRQRVTEASKDEGLETANEYLNKAAVTDALTGIGNMYSFIEEVSMKLADKDVDLSSKIFIFMDIENFKSYNHQFGFQKGSELLFMVAEKLVESFPGDPVARFSDDHFVAFTDADGFKDKLEKVRRAVLANNEGVFLGLNAGGYRMKDRGEDVTQALDYARYACGTLKKRYDEDFAIYDEKMGEEYARMQYIVNNIDTAVEKGWIKVFYQPVVWSESDETCGFEALARWDDPSYGFLSPAAFISVLEDYRQIHKLDREVVRRVCHDIRSARQKGLPVIPVSLNFSRLDFELMDIPAVLEEYTTRYEVDHSLLHVEVTESALTESKDLQRTLRKIKDAGYSLWLDDFGSGYSSLNVLKDYDFDVMKIDMKFLQNFSGNPKSKVISKSIVEMATGLGMRTLTEGVETDEQAEFLKEIGCERLQGYLFGKPVPRDIMRAGIHEGTLVVAKDL